MVGVGIVGFGYWGPNYLRILKQCDEVDYLAVCDMDPARLAAITPGNVAQYADYKAFLDDKQINAVIIATPSPNHYTLAKQALEAGKHLLIEKPVTLIAAQAKELNDLAKKQEKVLATGHIFLYNDGIDFLKKHIQTPAFGSIHEIECIRQGHGPIRTEINVMWDLATHDISILLHLLDQMPSAVSAQGWKYRQETKQEDSVVMTLLFSNGIQSIIKVNWQYPIKERRITVIGSNQMIRFSDTEPTAPISIYYKAAKPHGELSNPEYGAFKMITSDDGYMVPAVKIREPLLLQIQDFFSCIKTKAQPKSSGLLGYDVVRILEAGQESLNKNGALMAL